MGCASAATRSSLGRSSQGLVARCFGEEQEFPWPRVGDPAFRVGGAPMDERANPSVGECELIIGYKADWFRDDLEYHRTGREGTADHHAIHPRAFVVGSVLFGPHGEAFVDQEDDLAE